MNLQIIISAIILSIGTTYTTYRMNDNKSIIKYIFLGLMLPLYFATSYTYITTIIRYVLFIFVLTLLINQLLKTQLKKAFIISIIIWLTMAISELILAFIIVLQKIDIQSLFGTVISNSIISMIMATIVSIKPINKFIKKIINKFYDNKKYNMLFTYIIFIISISSIIYINYFDISNSLKIFISLFIILVYSFIVITIFNEKANNKKIQIQYENVLKNLEEYEKMLDYQRVANHENKNQLLVIKGMIKKNEKDIIEYIDSIIKEKREDNEEFYMKTKRIPSGGLQGLIYYKLLLMKEKNINVSLNICTNVRKFKIENQKLNKDLCKIIGVLLDNAIQAVENLKEKNIEINMYNDDEFEIEIMNNFNGTIDLSKIDEIGYTTKEKGHGYGLSLVKQIIETNEKIENKKNIVGKTFTQKIIIKK